MMTFALAGAVAGTAHVPATGAARASQLDAETIQQEMHGAHSEDDATGAASPEDSGQVITGKFTGAAGSRPWRLYLPASKGNGNTRPMLVMLHGCTQNAADIARGTRLDAWAEHDGLIVLYPEQLASANARVCWNWFDAAHQRRDAGEPAIIAGMVAQIAAQYRVDARRVYIAGVSAGGAMATLVAAAYPERFAAVASASATTWSAATNVSEALKVMLQGTTDAPARGAAAFAAMGGHAQVMPALVIHGGKDVVVAPVNGDESAVQWVVTNNLTLQSLDKPDLVKETEGEPVVQGSYHVTTRRWTNSAGQGIVEEVKIAELGHAWSGGSLTGTFTDANGPDATRLMLDFLLRHVRAN